MAPLDGAEKAAVLDLFAGRRGTRTLIESSREKLAAYFVAKGTTVKELTTVRPSDPDKVKAYLDEWMDAAEAAGIVDGLDKKNVVRFFNESLDLRFWGTFLRK